MLHVEFICLQIKCLWRWKSWCLNTHEPHHGSFSLKEGKEEVVEKERERGEERVKTWVQKLWRLGLSSSPNPVQGGTSLPLVIVASSAFGPSTPFHWGPPWIGAGASALCHIYDLAGTWFFIPVLCRWHPAVFFPGWTLGFGQTVSQMCLHQRHRRRRATTSELTLLKPSSWIFQPTNPLIQHWHPNWLLVSCSWLVLIDDKLTFWSCRLSLPVVSLCLI